MDKDVKIIRSRRKTISLQVKDDASVVLKAPWGVADRYIEGFIQKHDAWIERKKDLMMKRLAQEPHHRFDDGEELLYMGKRYKLFRDGLCSAVRFSDSFYIPRGSEKLAKAMMIKWYREVALKVIEERVKSFASVNGLRYKRVKISNAIRKWGSCSARGDLRFSWKLVMAPLPVIDYVVAHELAHLKVRNHSKAFWKQVGVLMPTYEASRAWLKENGHTLKI